MLIWLAITTRHPTQLTTNWSLYWIQLVMSGYICAMTSFLQPVNISMA